MIADINECEFDMLCPASSMCVNTNGSFVCVCVNGTQMDLIGNCTGSYNLITLLALQNAIRLSVTEGQRKQFELETQEAVSWAMDCVS